ncbi:MAG: hypothetical protein ACOZE5_18375 [Verrucomicrobiota bacterium]
MNELSEGIRSDANTAAPGTRRWREWFSWLGLACLVAAIWGAPFLFPRLWDVVGVRDLRPRFLDLYGSLAAAEAAQVGMDPYQPNPLDPLMRPHFYSSWWLMSGQLGLGRDDVMWLGAVLVAACLAVAVVWLRPRGCREWGLALLLLISPAFLLAVNRANNDLVIFLLLSAALVCLKSGREALRLGGVAFLSVAAVLKYYPSALLLLLLTAPTARQLARDVAVAAFVLLLGFPSMLDGLQAAGLYWSGVTGPYAFGATVLWQELQIPRALANGGLVIAGAGLGAWIWRGRRAAAPMPVECIAGSAILLACFVLGNTYAYKLIFSVWLLPGLWRARESRLSARVMLYAVLLAAWTDGLTVTVANLREIESPNLPYRLLLGVSQLSAWCIAAIAFAWLADFVRHRVGHLQLAGVRPPLQKSDHAP